MENAQPTGSSPSLPLPGGRIEMRQDTDTAFWCRVFDISPAQLRRAVQQVGPQVAEVRRYLAKMQPPRWPDDSGF